jgi:hypothetical protein
MGTVEPWVALRLTQLLLDQDRSPRRVVEALGLARYAATRLGPDNLDALENLAEAYAAAGQFEGAALVLEHAVGVAAARGDSRREAYLRRRLAVFRLHVKK